MNEDAFDDADSDEVRTVYTGGDGETFQRLDVLGHLFMTTGNVLNAIANGFAAIGMDLFRAAKHRRCEEIETKARQQMAADLDRIVNGDS